MANAILDRADQIISAYNAGAGYKAVLIANLVNTLCVSCRHRFGHERQYFKTGVCGLLPIETSGARCSYYEPAPDPARRGPGRPRKEGKYGG